MAVASSPVRRGALFPSVGAAALAVALVATGCHSTAGRLHFAGEGEKEGTLKLGAGDVRFVAELQVAHARGAAARYDVLLLQHGDIVDRAVCAALPIRDASRSCTYRFGDQSLSCSIVMKCRAHLDQGGLTLVRAHLVVTQKSPDFVLERADFGIVQ